MLRRKRINIVTHSKKPNLRTSYPIGTQKVIAELGMENQLIRLSEKAREKNITMLLKYFAERSLGDFLKLPHKGERLATLGQRIY